MESPPWLDKGSAMIDVETNQILSLEVTDEATQDDQVFEMLLDRVEQNSGRVSVKSVLGDGPMIGTIVLMNSKNEQFGRG
jgi:hypothetical protein